jgi:hypothetical protein
MTGVTTAAYIAAGAVAASTIYSANQGKKQAAAQERAGAQAAEASKVQAKQAEEQINRQNQKTPDAAAMMSANRMASKAGNAGTMLTGPMGVAPGSLELGKNTLLGS